MSADLTKQAASFKAEVDHSRTELEAANQIRPQMLEMQKDLASAKSDIDELKENPLKYRRVRKKSLQFAHNPIFNLSDAQNDKVAATVTSIVVPPKNAGGLTLVYLLLPEEPIDQTIDLQYRTALQPRNSYFHVQNIIVFYWGEPAENLKLQPLSVSYFPDSSVKDIAHTLSYHDGRVFADDQPMPKFNEIDPDFKGNKWIKLGAP